MWWVVVGHGMMWRVFGLDLVSVRFDIVLRKVLGLRSLMVLCEKFGRDLYNMRYGFGLNEMIVILLYGVAE